MEALSNAAAVLSAKVPPWAAITALLMLSGSALILSLIQLGQKFGMFARDISGNGATPSQVRAIVDEKVNGSDLRKIAEKVAEMVDRMGDLAAEVRANRAVADTRHAENQREFGLIHGRLGSGERRG